MGSDRTEGSVLLGSEEQWQRVGWEGVAVLLGVGVLATGVVVFLLLAALGTVVAIVVRARRKA
jgi:4-amino-4-deoxy-L-arabinose transferase-like glycosyltransferase